MRTSQMRHVQTESSGIWNRIIIAQRPALGKMRTERKKMEYRREARKGFGDEIPKRVWGPKPAAAGGRNRQAERRESQGAPFMVRLCEFPGLAPLSRFGTGARRAQWAKQAGGTSGNGKERLRDYSVSWMAVPSSSGENAVSEQTAKRSTIETGLLCRIVLRRKTV